MQRDTTVTFLPHRLNRQPVIVRGLTANELWVTVVASAAAGLVMGIAFAWVLRSVPVVPTVIVLSIAGGVYFGGGVLRRHKRNRPETWLYRQLQWWLCQHSSTLSGYLGAGNLITRSGYWTTRRTVRR